MAQLRVKIPKDQLYNLYISKKLSLRKIAPMFAVSYETIRERLNEYNIPIRRKGKQDKIKFLVKR